MPSAPIPRPPSARFAAVFPSWRPIQALESSTCFSFDDLFFVWFRLIENGKKRKTSSFRLGGNLVQETHQAQHPYYTIGAYERQKPWKSFDSAPLLSLTCFSFYLDFSWLAPFSSAPFLSPRLYGRQSINGECIITKRRALFLSLVV